MHIAAVMAVLNIDDLDHTAKHAVTVIACRADRYTGMVEVSIPRVAADMGVGYYAAQRGLYRAVKAGYLAVDKCRGRAPLWRLTTAIQYHNHRDPVTGPPRSSTTTTAVMTADVGVEDLRKESAAAPLDSGGAGENLPPVDFQGAAARLRLIRNGAGG